ASRQLRGHALAISSLHTLLSPNRIKVPAGHAGRAEGALARGHPQGERENGRACGKTAESPGCLWSFARHTRDPFSGALRYRDQEGWLARAWAWSTTWSISGRGPWPGMRWIRNSILPSVPVIGEGMSPATR